MTRNCDWCAATFEPKRDVQVYCSNKCRRDRQSWLKTHAPALGNKALDGDDVGLMDEAERLRVKYETRLQSPAKSDKVSGRGGAAIPQPAHITAKGR
jgi:hypothetical protein